MMYMFTYLRMSDMDMVIEASLSTSEPSRDPFQKVVLSTT